MIRLLTIDPATGKDATGRALGDDWLICETPHGWVTTDRVRASEVGDLDLPDDAPASLAAICEAAGRLASHHRAEWVAIMARHHPWERIEVGGEVWWVDRYGMVHDSMVAYRPVRRGACPDLAGLAALLADLPTDLYLADDVDVWLGWNPLLLAVDDVHAVHGGTMLLAILGGRVVAVIAAHLGGKDAATVADLRAGR